MLHIKKHPSRFSLFKQMLYILPVFCLISNLWASEPKTTPINVEQLKASQTYKKFMGLIGAKLQAFQKEHMPKAESVFYPFGGPDLLHPLLLFPDAKTYVLVGLELPGAQLTEKNQDEVFNKINSLLKRGFFVTANMSKTFNQKSGVRAALALQILLVGGTILEDTAIDANTISITFEWNGQERVAYYLRRDLVTNADSLFEFLNEHHVSDACLLKSSSYSLHRKFFSDLKTRIVDNFKVLVQDDTGVPFKNLKDFDIQVFGNYTGPYGKEWRGYEQPNLKKMFETSENVPHLNFCFGYGCGRVEANILIATRKSSHEPPA